MNKDTCEKIEEYIKAIQFKEKSTDTLVVDVKPVLDFLEVLIDDK